MEAWRFCVIVLVVLILGLGALSVMGGGAEESEWIPIMCGDKPC